MKKLGLIPVLLAVIALMVFAGGQREAGPSGGELGPYQGTTLNVATYRFEDIDQYLRFAHEAAADLGITLDIHYFTFDGLRDKLVADYRAGLRTWDIIMIDPKWVAEFALAGINTPLQRFMDDPAVADLELLDLDDFFEASLAQGIWDNTVQSLPVGVSLVVNLYRTDILEHPEEQANFQRRYGYPLGPPRTYQQVMDMAEFFTRKAGERLAGEVLNANFYGTLHSNRSGGFVWHDYIPYIVAAGGHVAYDPETMQPTWNSPENLAVGEFYKQLTDFMPDGHLGMTSGETVSWFAEGRIAIHPEFLHRAAYIADNSETSRIIGKFAYDVLPNWEGAPADRNGSTLVSGGTVGIYARSRNQEAAYKVIERSLSYEYQYRTTVEEWGFIPVRKSIARDEELVNRFPYLGVLRTYANEDLNLFIHPQIPEYPRLMDSGARAVHRALSGEVSVQRAYNEAQAEMVEIMRRAGYID